MTEHREEIIVEQLYYEGNPDLPLPPHTKLPEAKPLRVKRNPPFWLPSGFKDVWDLVFFFAILAAFLIALSVPFFVIQWFVFRALS